MRILHVCLAVFYIDKYSYQENVLPKMHKLQGHEVHILASTETYLENTILGYTDPGTYKNEDGIIVTRVSYSKILPHKVMRKLRVYKGVNDVMNTFKPDIIFVHGCQFISIYTIASYLKKNPVVRLYVDGHADFFNSAKNWFSKNILHRLVYRWCAKKIEAHTRKFYGVLPIRVEFIRNMYGISDKKIELLPLGIDDSIVDFKKKRKVRSTIRDKLGIAESDFVIVTGGKIDKRKNIHTLMKAVGEIGYNEIKLIVFGTPNKQMKKDVETLSKHKNISYVGWVRSNNIYDYFMASDIAFFPGTHSVLWEQAVGFGIPCIFRKYAGIQHVDIGGNCLFIDSDEMTEIQEIIIKVFHDTDMFSMLKQSAKDKGIEKFSYSNIAKCAIEG